MKRDFKYYFLYLFGSLLPFFVLFSHFEIVEAPFLIYLSIIFVLLFVLLLQNNKRFNKLNYFILVVLLISLIVCYQQTSQAFVQIYNSIVHEYNKNVGIRINTINIQINRNMIYFIILYFVVVIQYFISNITLLFMNKQKYGCMFFVSLILSLPILIIQINLNWIVFILLISYWFSLYVYSCLKNVVNPAKIYKLSFLIIFLLSFSSIIFIGNFSEYKLKAIYNPVTISQEIMDTFNEWIQKFSDLQVNNNEVDLRYARNRVYLDTVHLEVETDHVQPYYLKCFSGAVYSDNKWSELDELNLLKSNLKEDDFNYAFQYIKRYTLSESDVDEIIIKDKRRGSTFSIYPYYIRSIDQEYEMYRDMYMIYDSDIATFQTWDINEVTYSVDSALKYSEFVEENYVFVPLNIQTLFKSKFSLEEYQPNSSENRVEFAKKQILSLLSNYTYTLSPGGTPNDKDFIEYFLTENKKGYCVHFASAATLMFRYYGIPARYVEGYYVSSSQFKDGKAEVLDSDAHAWVEIYDNYLGWIPVEVTVGQDEIETDEPENPNTPNRPNNQQNQNNLTNQNTQQNNELLPPLPIGNDGKFDMKEFIMNYSYIIIAVLCFIIYFVYRFIRIRVRKNKMNQKNRKHSVYAMYEYLVKINQYTPIFTDNMIILFEKNKFSKEGLNLSEYNSLKEMVCPIPKEVYQSLKFIQKVKYKYIDCLI